MSKLGDLNFELEAIVDFLCDKECFKSYEILNIVFDELNHHESGKEEFLSGENPLFENKKSKKQIKAVNIKKRMKNLVTKYIKEHDLQWGEVLYIVYGYLRIHRPCASLKYFKYE